jgi:cell division protein FtsN
MEDANGTGDDKMFSPELDEKVVLPSQAKKSTGEMELELQKAKQLEEKASETPKHEEHTATTPIAPSNSTYRVVVGQYATDKQAEVAKSILQDAGLGINPIVKNIGGSYTLQVGVFSSKDKAQQLSNNLLKSNFPARITE